MSSRVLLVGVVLSGTVMGAAQAADQSVPRGPTYYPAYSAYYPPGVNWTGFYVGLQGGGAFGNARWTEPFSGVGDDPKPAGLLGGGQIGVNWSQDSWLLGAEADFTAVSLDNHVTDSLGFTHGLKSTWLALITGRLGYAVNRYVVYVKGGFAVANERNTVTSPAGGFADSGMTTQYGWTIGGGIEYALNPNWSARLEYDFVDLPTQHIVLVSCGVNGIACLGPRLGAGLGSGPATMEYTIQKLVAAINYRF
jgi:outer membrane immunogenic protein